jgi:hypothetical protein
VIPQTPSPTYTTAATPVVAHIPKLLQPPSTAHCPPPPPASAPAALAKQKGDGAACTIGLTARLSPSVGPPIRRWLLCCCGHAGCISSGRVFIGRRYLLKRRIFTIIGHLTAGDLTRTQPIGFWKRVVQLYRLSSRHPRAVAMHRDAQHTRQRPRGCVRQGDEHCTDQRLPASSLTAFCRRQRYDAS